MRGEVQRKATLWRYASTSARVQDQQKDPIASSDKSMLSQSTDNEDGGSCGYNEPVYFPTSAKEMSPVFGAASAWFTPTMSQPPSLTPLDGAEYSRPCLDVPMVKLNPLDSVLTKLVCVDFDQLYFDRVYPFAPMVQRCRYSTWARNPNKTRPQACLQYAMWTLAASLSSQFQLVRRQLYLEARQILDALDIVSPDASLQSIEQAQAWVLLTIYELTCEDYRRGLVSAGRAFRLVQVMKLHQIDKQTSTSSQFEAVDLESMRRTFWLAYTLDRIVGAIDGLSMTFNEREIGTCLPAPDSHMMTNELPTAMSFLSDVLNGSGYEIFQDNPTGIDMSPFLESVVAATICGRVLDHKSRIPAEYEHGGTVQEFWRQHQSLNTFLRARAQVLSLEISSTVRLPDSMIIFAALVANVTMLMLWEIVESKPRGLSAPQNVLSEQRQALLTAVRELERLTHTVTQLNHFQVNSHISALET
ncbi:hypothetical protein S7711_01377 [Stachybotrys chartarum IBT 7711]|uniref:Xylanolytic transcriptional activator regulatory domain-containing protein n=1 Tax=Stachybotrys chartarum (strain CBS 109288 / IBT 7711) TaxID=1280523 RepID=A0A084BBW4_STACB|nr:hypothetical protein S7711_01377 [Stachybotrys chartarum IBT 7711]